MGFFGLFESSSSSSTSNTTNQTDQRQAADNGGINVASGASLDITATSPEAFDLASNSLDFGEGLAGDALNFGDKAIGSILDFATESLSASRDLVNQATSTSANALEFADGITRSDNSQTLDKFITYGIPAIVVGVAAWRYLK
ncbi:MAG: hypothetical protein OXR68_00240 [Alphaproteobacteria bacterium]|nr:hypothetical protein [Alphaproteobacteria bacterium]MDD9919040.1 hypothetical protein [Alphaproteobacteria bacterium]